MKISVTSLLLLLSQSAVRAQTVLSCETVKSYHYDSGETISDSFVVSHDGAPWVQLDLSSTELAEGASLVITGENGSQELDAKALAVNSFSAEFDGSSVSVKLSSSGGLRNGPTSRVVVSAIKVGMCDNSSESLCGVDDRIPSTDVRLGRIGGCSAYLISEDIFITAGHCGKPSSWTRIHFTFGKGSALPEDQYAVDVDYHQRVSGGVGNDWAAGRLLPNSSTGKLPGVRQSEKCGTSGCGWYTLGDVPQEVTGNNIRITGYGVASVDSQSQKTHVDALTEIGPTYLRYIPDTTGGNSGSPVIHEETGHVIGVHSHGGCEYGGNQGTRIDRADFRAHVDYLLSLCKTDVKADGKVDNYSYNKGWRVENHPRLLADVNGDGKLDIVGFDNSGVLVTLAAPCGKYETPKYMSKRFSYNTGWRVNKHPRFLEDVNGDGRADIVGFYENGVYVSLSYGTGFTDPQVMYNGFKASTGWTVEDNPRFVTDMNGDGKADLVGFHKNDVYVAYSNGSGFDEATIIVRSFFTKGSGWDVAKHPRFLEDVNGDGKKDVVGFGEDGVYVSYSNGNGYDLPKKMYNGFKASWGWTVEDNPRFVTDMNGDGKADLVGFHKNDVYVAYSNGSGFDEATIIVRSFFTKGSGWDVAKHPRFLEDVNGDGKKDVVGFGDDGVYVSSSNGNGYNLPKKMYNNFGYESNGWRVEKHPRFVTDMNGDGKADIVGFGGSATLINSF